MVDAGMWSAPGALLGRLVSVRRALVWAALGGEQAAAARFLGANCARLLDQVLASDGLSEAQRQALDAARAPLSRIDDATGPDRERAIRDASEALERVLPLSQLDARLPLDAGLQPRARLIVPAEGERSPPAPTAEAAPQAPRPPQKPEARPAGRDTAAKPASPKPEAPRPEAPRPEAPKAEAPKAEAQKTESPKTEAQKPEQEARAADPQDGRLALGHPGGTGQALPSELPPTVLEALDQAGIGTVADVLMTAPMRFDRPPLLDPAAEDPGEPTGVIRGRVRTLATRYRPGGRSVEITLAAGPTQVVTCSWEDRLPTRGAAWRPGVEIALVGELRRDADGHSRVSEGEPVGMDGRGSGWLPVYNVDGVPDALMRDLVAAGLASVMGTLRDPLSEGLLSRHRLLPLDEALRDAHFPANPNARGRHRLVFEELLGLSLALSRRISRGPGERGLNHRALHGSLGQMAAMFDLKLDDEQEAAFNEIRRDLLRPTPMNRVLEGEPGTAKGLIALMTALMVAENRSQVAIICGDPLSAERHFLFADAMLRAVGVKALFVGDQVNHAGADAIRRGEALIVFGTPRIVVGEVEWRRLGLVIVHEQSTLATVLPHQLDTAGPRPDLLVVAGGPIPPMLLLTAYGTFDVSSITRKVAPSVTTRAWPASERAAAYEIVHQQVAAGRQALVVFPVRAGRDVLTRDDATRFADALLGDLPQGTRVSVYSSDMSREERLRCFDDFQHRRVGVLVCTTLIEDGPSVPNCNVVVVEHADHVDLVRLHRLRGHVGRGPFHGHCLLVTSNTPAPDADQALSRLLGESPRLELSDEDLNTPRGPRVDPAVLALEPPSLTWAELPRDRALLLEARQAAFRLLREDNTLRQHGGLRRLIQDRWPELLGEPERPGPSAAADAGKGRRKRRRKRRR